MSDEPEEIPAEEQGRSLVIPAKLEADTGNVLAIIPRDVEEASRFASGMIKAGIVPSSFRKDGRRDGEPNASLVLMGIMKSMEVGLPPITGIGGLLPINDRFAIWGDAAVALVQSKGIVANHKAQRIGPAFDPSLELGNWPDEYGWSVSFWRKGQPDPYIGRFTVRDAKRAQLWMNTRKEPWIKYPDRMLFNRARAFALRDGFPDALMGLAIAEEERDRLPDVEDGGKLEPQGKPAFLSHEPVTEEPISGEALVERDLGTPADLKGDF